MISDKIKKYINTPAVNQSFLKNIINNVTKQEDITVKTLLGSYVDTMITANELLDELYVVKDINLSETEYKILSMIAREGEWDRHSIQQCINAVGYYNNRHKDNVMEDKRVDEFLKHEEVYRIFLSGKEIISTQMHNEALDISSYLLTSEKTKRLFEDVKYQVDLYWDYVSKDEIVSCKGLLDILHETDTTMQIRDLKITGERLQNWKRSAARKYRYDLQLSFYQHGLFCNTSLNLLYPEIIVYSTTDRKAEVFRLTELDMLSGSQGLVRERARLYFEDASDANEFETDVILGWEDAIAIYLEAKQRGLEDFDVDYEKPKTLNLWC